MDCCDVNGLNRMFGRRGLERERRRFLRGDLDGRQQALLAGAHGAADLLDIGGGVGVLALSGLKRGLAAAHLVEVSTASLQMARRLAAETGVADRASFVQGDAARLDLPEVDLVTLDRVVCCYPDARALLGAAARASRRHLSFSYPPDRWWTRTFRNVINGGMRLLGREYRIFVHHETDLHTAAASDGHELVRVQNFGTWRVATFERPAAS